MTYASMTILGNNAPYSLTLDGGKLTIDGMEFDVTLEAFDPEEEGSNYDLSSADVFLKNEQGDLATVTEALDHYPALVSAHLDAIGLPSLSVGWGESGMQSDDCYAFAM